MEIDLKKHTLTQSIVLHLTPGILGGIVYFAIAQPVRSLGYPTISAMILALALVVTPFQILYLYRQGVQDGKFSLNGLIPYRQRLPVQQYLIWVPVVIVLSGLIVAFLGPVTEWAEGLFAWLPEAFWLDMGLSEEYSTQILIVTYVLILIFIAGIGPVVEEFYFRGYLLPRMPSSLKGFAPFIHCLLMALYHTWSPWMVIARIFGLLPLVYVVQRKRNIYIGMIAHCLLNTIDFVVGVVYIINRF